MNLFTFLCGAVLRADREAAYMHPEIKSVWDGTLEFPITYEPKPPAKAAP